MESFREFEDEAVGCVFAPLFGLASGLLVLTWLFGGFGIITDMLYHTHEHKSCLIIIGSVLVFSLFAIFLMHMKACDRVDEACAKYRSTFGKLQKDLEQERKEHERLYFDSQRNQSLEFQKRTRTLEIGYAQKENNLEKEYEAKKSALEKEYKQNNIASFLKYKQREKNLEEEYEQKEKDLKEAFRNKDKEQSKAFMQAIEQLDEERKQMEDEVNKKSESLNRERDEFNRLLKRNQIIAGSARLYAEWKTFEFDEVRQRLMNKPRPAMVAAEEVRWLKVKAKRAYEQCRAMEYKWEILLNQFPELSMYVDDEKSLSDALAYKNMETLVDDYDRRRDWLSKEEYQSLSDDERSQLSLDRYVKSKNKSDWQIGRDYELYCGYLYRQDGWKVEQQGISKKLNDLGRDIVAERGFDIHVVQCKLWSQKKEIHENVICQLFGTTKMYELEFTTFFADIKPVFMTNINLSKEAEKFAKHLGVMVRIEPMGDFPRIKCNISPATHEKIYHLPFDQQYDRTKIDQSGEFYAWTVEEAVSKGFRRAKRFVEK